MDLGFLYTSLKGRISRKTWWLGAIGLIIISIIVGLVMGVVGAAMGLAGSTFGLGLLGLITTAIIIFPYFALTTKRLHDRGRPDILVWIFIAPSVLSPILQMLGISGGITTVEVFGVSQEAFTPNSIGYIFTGAAVIIGLWALVELGFMKGDGGDNIHGPDPLA